MQKANSGQEKLWAVAARSIPMKKKLSTIILILIFLTGLSLLLYPTLSDYWNSRHASRAIASYVEQAANLNEEEYAAFLSAARAFNQSLPDSAVGLSDAQYAEYEQLLNVGGTGIMGYVEIEKIDVSLPIYHGTDEAVLQVGVGHLEWSSLPVGGEGSHCVLSGHRGLPSARLFTNIDQLIEGDTFVLHVLNEILTYQVDQILIVEPQDTSALQIVEGEDYCTLLTCTPYGVNSHRLLVRGHRVDNAEVPATVRVASDAAQVEPVVVAPLVALPMLLILLIVLVVKTRKKTKRKRRNSDHDT